VSVDTTAGRTLEPEESSHVKQCCARLYENQLVTRLLGDSFHPGGAALTERLGQLVGLTPESRVVDAASGKGTSALLLAQRFGCSVVGVDLSAQNVYHATGEAERLGLAGRVRFQTADAEQLPLGDGVMDAVICECAFCTFPDKAQAASEFARVLRPGGRVGLSDITRSPGPPGELADLMAWVACLADARPASSYAQLMADAGFTGLTIEPHDEALLEMIRRIGRGLFATEVMAGLNKIDLTGIDLAEIKRLTNQAMTAARENRLGYAIVCGTK
jgi:ubiquinone/menaquinone biosynthesis C-methylase UbiE